MANSRGKQRHHHDDEHEEHVNHEAWVIPYADVLTLLMALFLVLWAIGPDDEKLEVAADSFRRELGRGESLFDLGIGSGGSGPLTNGAASVLDGAGPSPVRSDLVPGEGAEPTETTMPIDAIAPPVIIIDPGVLVEPELPAGFEPVEDADEIMGDPLTEVEQVVRSRAAATGLSGAVEFRREARGLVVTIVTDQVLFEEGRAAVQPDGIRILDVVAEALMDLPNAVTIEGHTDSRPISTAQFPSNWELSTARATSVLRYLVEERAFPRDRLSAAGYADTRPLAEGDDAAALARNRRVEIVVLATAAAA